MGYYMSQQEGVVLMASGWGPGWIYDVFDVKVLFDNNPPVVSDCGAGGDGEVFADPWYAYDGLAYLFCGHDAVVSGTITLTSTNGGNVHHLGIKIIIGEYIHYLDPYVPTRLKHISNMVAEPGMVAGEATYTFRVPLDTISKAPKKPLSSFDEKAGEYPNLRHWLNTYNGNSFAIRHMLSVEIYRPWYTFNLHRYKNLSFQLMEGASNQNCIPKKSQKDSDIMTRNKKSNEHTVPETFYVDGLTGGGKCRVTLHSTHINLATSPVGYSRGGEAGDGAIIRGTLELLDLEETVASAKCMLIRAEVVGSEISHDSLECEHLLFGVEEADIVETLEDEDDRQLRIPQSRGYISRQDIDDGVVATPRVTDPVRKGTTITFEICLDGSGRNNEMNACPSSVAEDNNKRGHISHELRIQNALWQNLAHQLYPTFYYVPLDLTYHPDYGSGGSTTTQLLNSQKEAPDLSQLSVSPKETDNLVANIHSVASDEAVCLRYYLRVAITEKSGRKLWDTAELVFYYSLSRNVSIKNAFMSARSSQGVAIIPPYLQTSDRESTADFNDAV